MEKNEQFVNQELRKNSSEAYRSIFRKYYRDMLCYSLSFAISMDDAKDLVQSAFIKLWENRSTILDDKPIKSYLTAIVKNNCLDFIRHSKVIQEYEEEVKSTPLDFKNVTYDQLTDKELEGKVAEAIFSLPERCRQIFVLNRFVGLKNIEIARKLEISPKTVENQMTIALDKLKSKLIHYLS